MNFKINDAVYVNVNERAEKCTVMEEARISGDRTVIKVKHDSFGVSNRLLTDLFQTKQGCENYIKSAREQLKKKYFAEIKDTKDLIRFMYAHNVSGCDECTDWAAREVAFIMGSKFGVDPMIMAMKCEVTA